MDTSGGVARNTACRFWAATVSGAQAMVLWRFAAARQDLCRGVATVLDEDRLDVEVSLQNTDELCAAISPKSDYSDRRGHEGVAYVIKYSLS